MKVNGPPPRDKESQKRWSDLVSALDSIESREKVHIKFAIPYEIAEKVALFLKEKGMFEDQGIPLLIQRGLLSEDEEELERLKNEMKSENCGNMWSEYAVMKFRAYEYFMENKGMVMNLSRMLDENRMLKRRLEMEGLTKLIPGDECDNWDQSMVDAYYKKYVFGERE